MKTTVTLATIEEVLNHQVREYNPFEWAKTVNRYQKYDPTYYMDAKSCYVKYSVEGINYFKELSYSSCLSTMGFTRVDFAALMANGMTEGENIKSFLETGAFVIDPKEVTNQYVVSNGFFYCEGKEVVIPNSQEGKRIMREKSKHGVIFTNEQF